MITELEIYEIIGIKYPNPVTDIQYLSVIRKYIFDRKKIDIGEIERPHGQQCISFLHAALQKGINPIKAMQMSSDIHLMNFLFEQAARWYNDKKIKYE